MLPLRISLEDKVLKGLETIGYTGPLASKADLLEAIDGGPKSTKYTQLVSFLTNEIRTLENLDEQVNTISAPEDAVAFVMELTSFLRELNCPYSSLIEGPVSERLQNTSDCLTVLDYLITELMGARISQESKPDKKIELKLQETDEAADMRKILQTLRFPKPPSNLSVAVLFERLNRAVVIAVEKAGLDLVGNAIFNGFLSNTQWKTLAGVQEDLNNEYKIRREMMLTRLDVTIQSFQWSDKTKGKEPMIEKIYTEKRKSLKVDPDVDLTDLLAARTDLAIIEKTSNSSVRKFTRTSLNKVIIGQVPDRGGRTSEIAPPPPEMPSWQQQRSAGPPGGGRGGGRGGGNFNRGGGNFSKGDYNSGRQNSSFNDGGNNYNTGNNYSSGSSYSSGASNYNRGNYNSSGGRNYSSSGGENYNSSGGGNYSNSGGGNKSFDSAGTYTVGGHSNRSGYDNNRGNKSVGYDNYGSNKSDNRSYDNSGGNYGGSSYSRDTRGSGGYSDQSYNREDNRRDSGGYHTEQTSKRAKTYDNFQANKTTYADQYVQDSQQNQQYHSRGNSGGGRGRSNYSRGRGRGGHDYR